MMIRLPLFTILLGLALSVSAQETGFFPLLNGKNLDGWQNGRGKDQSAYDGKAEAHQGRFKVAEGVLIIDPAVKGDLYLATRKSFAGDVTIRFEFNAGPRCNNDVFLRGSKFDIVPGKNETKAVTEGDWHAMEIVVSGDTIEHKIDGASVRKAKVAPGASSFMLRAEFGTIQYRNIRCKE